MRDGTASTLFNERKAVANVCVNFVVTGLKEDQNTKLKMSHSPKNTGTALVETEMRSKLWAMFLKHIYPVATHEFGWLFDPITHWMKRLNVGLFAHFVSNVTAGKLFWPRSHTDPNLWYVLIMEGES